MWFWMCSAKPAVTSFLEEGTGPSEDWGFGDGAGARGHCGPAYSAQTDDERRAALRDEAGGHPAWVHGLVQCPLPEPGGGRAAAGAEHGPLPPVSARRAHGPCWLVGQRA